MAGTRFAALSAMLALTMLARGRARADETERVRLGYRAPAGCPTRDAFVAQVGRRTSRAEWQSEGDDLRHFDVRVERHGTRSATGRLEIRAPGVAAATRNVKGRNCDEVVEALALVTALAVDPKAKTAPLPDLGPEPPPIEPPVEAPPPPLEPPPPPPGSDRAGATGSGAPRTEYVILQLLREPRQLGSAAWPIDGVATPGAPAPRDGWRAGAGAHGGFTTGVGDKLALVITLFVDVAYEATDAVWQPSVRLGATLLPDREAQDAGATASFQRFGAELSACPIRFFLSRSVGLRPCLALEAGVLAGDASGLPGARSDASPWLALGPRARLGYAIAPPIGVELEAGIAVPLVRPSFLFEPDRTVLAVDPVLVTLGGGLTARFY
jgi:hypothetical protein